MDIKQKLPWVRPTLRELDATQEIIDLFPRNMSAYRGADVTRDEEKILVFGDRVRS